MTIGNFKIHSYHLLLFLHCFDVILEGWFGIWYVKIFVTMINSQFYSFSHMLSSALGILAMYTVIKKYEKPTLTLVVVATAITYLGLFALMFSPNVFLIVNTLLGAMLGAIGSSFRNNINALNVPQHYRVKFDNWTNLLTNLSLIIGSFVAYFTIAETIVYWKIWLAMYLLFDVDLVIKLIFIKKGFIRYLEET